MPRDRTPPSAGFEGGTPNRRDLLLLLLATAPLWLGLDYTLWGSETRWVFVARDMAENGSWFEPQIAGRFMGYKPLLSYWAIALPALALGGVGEVLARLPSALAGVLTVLLTAWTAARLVGREGALLAGVVLATSYTFALWSRSASADALNLLFTTAAIAVYVEGLHRFRPGWIVVFFVVMGLGCGFKGTPALLVPLAVVGVDLLAARRFHLLAHWRAGLLGLALGAACFLVPFWLSYLAKGDWELLWWVWNENFVRATDAFDHVEPVWYYAAVLPAMLLPWGLWLPGATLFAVREAPRNPGVRFAALAFLTVFLAFTASESRRSYYLLPAFPFAAIVIAAYARSVASGGGDGLSRALAVLPLYVLGAGLAGVGLLLSFGGGLPPDLAAVPEALPGARVIGSAALLAAAALLGCTARGRLSAATAVAMAAAVGLFLVLSTSVQTLRESLKVERSFAARIHERFPGEPIVFYNGATGPLRYYVGGETVVRRTREIRALLEEPGDAVLVVCGDFCEEGMPEDRRYDAQEVLRGTQPGLGRFIEPRDRYYLFRVTKR